MDYLEKILKKTGIISIIESLIFIVIGLFLFWKAEFALKVISYILGSVFIILGIIEIIKYFIIYKNNYETFNYQLIFGLMTIVIGIITIFYSSTIETILRIIIGIWIIYSSLVKFAVTLRLKSLGLQVWGYSLFFSILMLICGLYIIFNAGAILATIGIAMVIYSIIDIIEDIIYLKNIG